MKKIVVLVGSRRKQGNTATFINKILKNMPKNKFEIEYIFPQDFKIRFCSGCQKCFSKTFCVQNDELGLLQDKILTSDLFIVASPVYLHYMSADLKLILDRLSWWSHTLRLQGKPTIVLSTCDTNGHNSVIEPLSQMMNWMGGNVIAAVNAACIPDQINNEKWIQSVSMEIEHRIVDFSFDRPESNPFLEQAFANLKLTMKAQEHLNIESGELNYWKETGMLKCNTFSEYLNKKSTSEII